MSTKLIVLVVVLLVGVGVSVYLWTSRDEDQGPDQTVMAERQSFTCQKCGASFQKTVEEVIKERRTHDGHIYCPNCGAEDPEKEGVKVRMGLGGGDEEAKAFDSDDEAEEEEEEVSDQPKLAPPGMQRRG